MCHFVGIVKCEGEFHCVGIMKYEGECVTVLG